METTIAPPAAAEPELAAVEPAEADRQRELAAELREAILRKVGAVSARSAAESR